MVLKALGYLLLVACASGAAAKPPTAWEFKEWSVAMAQSKVTGKPIFVLFGYESCYWCEYFYRRGMNDEDLVSKYQKGVILAYVDTKNPSQDAPFEMLDGTTIPHSEFIKRFAAYPTPSWVFLSSTGSVLLSNRGGKSTSREMLRDLEGALSKRPPG